MTLLITAFGGANYWSIAAFWPLECQILFGPNAVKVALYVLPFSFSVLIGVILVNIGISLFGGANRELLAISRFVSVNLANRKVR